MLGIFFGKRVKRVEEETRKSFETVKKDFEGVGKWINHLDTKDKQLFEHLEQIKNDLSTIKTEIETLKEKLAADDFSDLSKQLSKKPTAVQKQTGVYAVQKAVQTPVQTANFYEFLQGLSATERLIIFTLMNSPDDMKLSYEDLARLLGKERSTIRGQVNAIKQKSEGLILEKTEPNGKKRLYIPIEFKEKLEKYAKVRVKKKKRSRKKRQKA